MAVVSSCHQGLGTACVLSGCGEPVTPRPKPWFHAECLLSVVQRRQTTRSFKTWGGDNSILATCRNSGTSGKVRLATKEPRERLYLAFPPPHKEDHGPIDGDEELWLIFTVQSVCILGKFNSRNVLVFCDGDSLQLIESQFWF